VYLLKSFVYWMLATALNTVKRFSKRQGTLVEVCELKACLRWAWFKQNHLSPKNNWQLKTASRSCLVLLRSEISSSMCAKLCTMAASNNRDHPTRSLLSSPLASTINCSPGSQASLEVTHQDHSIGITLLFLVRTTYIYFCSSSTCRSWWITQSTQHHRRGCNNIPSFFTMNHTDCTFFVWRPNLARPLHPGHNTIFLRSEIPSSMCAKLRTVAASNNRDHLARSLSSSPLARTINCSPSSQASLDVTHQDHSTIVRATYIYFCSSSTCRSWWITQSTKHHQRGCNSTLLVFYHF